MARLAYTAALAGAVFTSLPARAELPQQAGQVAEATPAVNTPATPVVSATSPPARGNDEAARLFHEAEAHYEAGDVAGALELMESSYAQSHRPELLFNVGQLRRELGQCTAARKAYTEYLARVPAGRRRDEARHLENSLRQQCPDAPPIAPPAAPSTEARRQYWTPMTIAGWSTIGTGAVAAVVATSFAIKANQDEATLEARMSEAQGESGAGFTANDKRLENEGRRAANWASGLFVGSAGLVAVGVTLLLLDTHRGTKTTTALAVGFDTRAATAVWRGSF
jgi:hypothetical protein